jgi:hypothetical protein
VVVTFAPVLHDLAGHLSGRDPSRWTEDPVRWAYAVREAVSMVRPTWVVSHFDPDLEARAIAELASEPDEVWDVELLADGPFAPAIELVRTLAGVDSDWTVAASVTGPRQTAASLGERWNADDLDELQEACGDVAAALVAAYAEAGAREILVWEPEPVPAAAAHEAITRRAALAGVPLTLVAPTPLDGYARNAVTVPADNPDVWTAALRGAAPGAVVTTDGPVPGDTSPDVLVALTAGVS